MTLYRLLIAISPLVYVAACLFFPYLTPSLDPTFRANLIGAIGFIGGLYLNSIGVSVAPIRGSAAGLIGGIFLMAAGGSMSMYGEYWAGQTVLPESRIHAILAVSVLLTVMMVACASRRPREAA